jgi:hypothetical protein
MGASPAPERASLAAVASKPGHPSATRRECQPQRGGHGERRLRRRRSPLPWLSSPRCRHVPCGVEPAALVPVEGALANGLEATGAFLFEEAGTTSRSASSAPRSTAPRGPFPYSFLSTLASTSFLVCLLDPRAHGIRHHARRIPVVLTGDGSLVARPCGTDDASVFVNESRAHGPSSKTTRAREQPVWTLIQRDSGTRATRFGSSSNATRARELLADSTARNGLTFTRRRH